VGYLVSEGGLQERDEWEINVVTANNIKDECTAQLSKKEEKICELGFESCSFRILPGIIQC
jgi:hypothetical protein